MNESEGKSESPGQLDIPVEQGPFVWGEPRVWDRLPGESPADHDARVMRRFPMADANARGSLRACLDPTGPERPCRRVWLLTAIVAILGALLLWPALALFLGR